MIVVKTANELSEFLRNLKKSGKSVGFVPTMGALHDGHISLIKASNKDTALTVCSIFVNPTQFNNKEDFKFYPITLEKDIERLIESGCDVLFLPNVAEIYPPGKPVRHYDLGELENILEGNFRPGHFQGVCQAVDRLLEIVEPNFLYLGQKDYQQCMILTRLIEITGRKEKIKLLIAPTVREKDGLAMSSRNLRLTHEQRSKALVIYRQLSWIKKEIANVPFFELKKETSQHLAEQGFSVDYVEIANADTLKPASDGDEHLVALIAATLGNIRLIDNMILN